MSGVPLSGSLTVSSQSLERGTPERADWCCMVGGAEALKEGALVLHGGRDGGNEGGGTGAAWCEGRRH